MSDEDEKTEVDLLNKGLEERGLSKYVSLIAFVFGGVLVGSLFTMVLLKPEPLDCMIDVLDENGFVVESFSEQDVLIKLSLTQNTMLENQNVIGSALGVLQEQRLCGLNQLIPDSNIVNYTPRGVVYSCFAPVTEVKE